MPWCQLRLRGGPVKRIASTHVPGYPASYVNESRPTLHIDVIVPGTDQFALGDIQELFFAALWPTDTANRRAVEKRFRAAGVRDWQLSQEILPTDASCFDQASLRGSGQIDLRLQWHS